jgi:predicted DNA-binding transcriptional regulator AlpA
MAKEIPKLFTENETAALLGTAPDTLAVWRCTRRYSLPYVKIGRLVRYRESDVIAFLESRTIRPQAAAR